MEAMHDIFLGQIDGTNVNGDIDDMGLLDMLISTSEEVNMNIQQFDGQNVETDFQVINQYRCDHFVACSCDITNTTMPPYDHTIVASVPSQSPCQRPPLGILRAEQPDAAQVEKNRGLATGSNYNILGDGDPKPFTTASLLHHAALLPDDNKELLIPSLPPLPPLAAVADHGNSLDGRRWRGAAPMRKGTPSYREAHIHSERKRRQDMTSLFSSLRSLLPNHMQHDFKSDRCTTLGYVIEYVQELDQKVQVLAKVKEELQKREKATLKREEEEEAEEDEERWYEYKGLGKLELISSEESQEVFDIFPSMGLRAKKHSTVQTRSAETLANSSVTVRFWGSVDIFITLNCPKTRGLWPRLMALLQDTLQLDVQNVTLSATPFYCLHSIYAKVVDTNDDEFSCDKLRETLTEFVTAYNSL